MRLSAYTGGALRLIKIGLGDEVFELKQGQGRDKGAHQWERFATRRRRDLSKTGAADVFGVWSSGFGKSNNCGWPAVFGATTDA